MKIKLTSIPVNDPNAAFKFYTEKSGFKELMHMPEAQLTIVVSPEQPEGTALLLEPKVDFLQNFPIGHAKPIVANPRTRLRRCPG